VLWFRSNIAIRRIGSGFVWFRSDIAVRHIGSRRLWFRGDIASRHIGSRRFRFRGDIASRHIGSRRFRFRGDIASRHIGSDIRLSRGRVGVEPQLCRGIGRYVILSGCDEIERLGVGSRLDVVELCYWICHRQGIVMIGRIICPSSRPRSPSDLIGRDGTPTRWTGRQDYSAMGHRDLRSISSISSFTATTRGSPAAPANLEVGNRSIISRRIREV